MLVHCLRRWPNIKPWLAQHLVYPGVGLYRDPWATDKLVWIKYVVTQKTRDAHPMLGQRRRRWPNTVPTLGERLVFALEKCDL